MITENPFLFNSILVLFIAFTAGWIVYVFSSKRSVQLKSRIEELENEKAQLRNQVLALEEQLEQHVIHPLNNTPVISLSSAVKANKSK